MRITYNCFAGISGDMNLAAMLDLGMDLELLKSELSKLNLDDEFELKAYPAEKCGINGTQVTVKLKHVHHHHHENDGHHHHHHAAHRNYSDIKQIIESSSLDDRIKKLSKDIFWEVAVAEGKVHNKMPEEVHFHEVGATDSIVDIVGAAICYIHLNIEHITSTTPELGGGFVMCQHGQMPVPAPATAEILHGIECSTGTVDKEMTTPTGAAILKVLSDEFIAHPSFNVVKTAYGIGHRDVAIPNVLRIYETKANSKPKQQSLMIECNIDDMTAEDLSLVPDLLLKAGARDAFLTPIIMKKGRSATMLSVLCLEKDLKVLSELVFIHTSTIGVRTYAVDKIELARQNKVQETKWGKVNYKESVLPNGQLRRKLEFKDLKTIADKESKSIAEMKKLILSQIHNTQQWSSI